ncbi:MAG: T9SS type A sorting domain-containing protein [Bacteroidota bacterium]
MRPFYLILPLLFMSFLAICQSPLVLNPNPVTIDADVSEDKLLPVAYLRNVSEDTVTFLWRRIIDELPRDWEAAVCDQTSCYSPAVDLCPDDSPNILAPGDSTTFYVQMKPNGVAGMAVLKLEAFPVGFPDSILVTGTYNYNVLLVGTEEVLELDAQLFPNPGHDYFQLTLPVETEGRLRLISSEGRVVKQFSLSANAQYDISDVPNGHYWLQLVRDDLKPVKAVPLLKQ